MTVRHLDPAWVGKDGIFGGHVLAVAVDAVDTSRWPTFRPQSVTLTFVSTLHPGPVEVRTEAVHHGRSTASIRIELHQDDRLRAHGIGSLVSLADGPGDHAWEAEPVPVRPGPEGAAPYVASYGQLPYLDQLDLRGVGVESMAGGATGWVRTRGSAADDLSPHGLLAVYLDVMPPGMFVGEPPPMFVPSLELTAHFAPRAGPASQPDAWFSVSNRTVWASDGFCVDECVLRDREGHLVALLRQGRQVRW